MRCEGHHRPSAKWKKREKSAIRRITSVAGGAEGIVGVDTLSFSSSSKHHRVKSREPHSAEVRSALEHLRDHLPAGRSIADLAAHERAWGDRDREPGGAGAPREVDVFAVHEERFVETAMVA